jgi:hypothetical protein
LSVFTDMFELAGDAIEGAADGLVKARRARRGLTETETAVTQERGKGRAGIVTDPDFELKNRGGYGKGDFAERPSGQTWDTLRRVAAAPPVVALHNVQKDGIAEFCNPQDNPRLPGFGVRMRDKGARYTPSKAEAKELHRSSRFMQHCGHLNDIGELTTRTDFEGLVRHCMPDSLRFDQFCMQVEPKLGWQPGAMTQKFVPHRLHWIPGHTIRLAMPPTDGTPLKGSDLKTHRYVQVDRHDEVLAKFAPQQLMFGVLNPHPDIENAGYGWSDLEKLTDVLTAWLYGYAYNRNYFKQGANVKGILHFDEEPPRGQQRRFERYFHALITGVGNAHKVPIAWGGKASWLSLGQNNRDMEFNEWMNFLTKLLCAIAGVDPAEIHFVFGNTGQSSAMGSASVDEKITQSRARWLRPRVRALFKWLNHYVIWPMNPDVEIFATGIDMESADAEHKRYMDLAEKTHYIDEVRAMMGDGPLEAVPEDMQKNPGKVILNQTWQQATQSMDGMEEGGGGEEGGEEGGGGEGAPEDGDDKAAEDRLMGGVDDEGGDSGGGGGDDGGEQAEGLYDASMIKSGSARDRVRATLEL